MNTILFYWFENKSNLSTGDACYQKVLLLGFTVFCLNELYWTLPESFTRNETFPGVWKRLLNFNETRWTEMIWAESTSWPLNLSTFVKSDLFQVRPHIDFSTHGSRAKLSRTGFKPTGKGFGTDLEPNEPVVSYSREQSEALLCRVVDPPRTAGS